MAESSLSDNDDSAYEEEEESQEDQIPVPRKTRRRTNGANDETENEADETGPSTSSARTYLEYDPNIFSSMIRYRAPSDIVANTIVQSQANGVDRYEIGKYLMMNSKTKSGNRRVSALIQQIVKTYPEQISQYQKMEGKVRILKYFYKGGESTPSSFLELLEKLEKLIDQKFPYTCSDVVQFPGKNLSSLRISDITLRRFLFILEFLKQEDVIILTWRLSRYISKKESDLGYQFAIDKKSLMKCLYALEQKQLLRVFKIDNIYGDGTDQHEEDVPTGTIQIVVPPEIDDPNDPRVSDAVVRVITELNEEGRLFPTGQYVSSKPSTDPNKQKKPKKKPKQVTHSVYEENLLSIEDRYKFMRYSFDSVRKKENSTDETKSDGEDNEEAQEEVNYGYQSKLIRCAILHEFIFYTVYKLNFNEGVPSLYDRFPLNKYLPPNTEPTPLESLPEVDEDPHSPYRHVVRIPPFRDAERGWFMIRDVLQGMPLSIFVLIVKPKKRIDGLQEYLDNPDRRHIPIADLPIHIRKQIFNRQSALVIEYLCLILSAIGLMRVAPAFEGKLNVMGPHALFYCGRKTYFYDTSTSNRGYALVTPPITRYTRYDYTFESVEDIHRYWCHLKAVCWSTSLGARHIPDGQEANFKSDTRKYSQGAIDRTPMTVDYDVEIDEIAPVGNADGCAGLDAQLFSHLQRNWELHAQPGSDSTEWFLRRWQHNSARLSSYVSEKVTRLEKNWNSYISSFLPTDLDLARKKKTEMPILTQKTLDSLSGSFRRHNSKRSLTPLTPARKTMPKKKSTLVSINSLLDTLNRDEILLNENANLPSTSKSKSPNTEKPKTRSKHLPKKEPSEQPEEEDESMDIDESLLSPEELQAKRRSGQKRKLDAIDMESTKLNMNLRSRFTSNEYDMLVLIRSISYFLNPIHRFWLNPTVMRDIMHLYVPESRCKTVSSLLAASAREMLRPGRASQLQYIVKTFSADKKMVEIRDKLAIQCKTDEEKNNVFWQAFRTAYKLIFDEANQIPDANVADKEFQKYLDKKKMSISLADSTTSGFPRRSRKPETIEDIQHCVAYNVVMSTLISEVCRSEDADDEMDSKNLIRSDCLINSISPAALTETLEICRSDGLVTKIRNNERKMHISKSQVSVSIYYRHFFNHFYRKDIIDLLKDVLIFPSQCPNGPANEDNPAALLHMVDFYYKTSEQFNVNLSKVTDLIDCGYSAVNVEDDLKDGKYVANKNMKQLENAPMRLENIRIDFPEQDELVGVSVPQREDLLPIICPVFECNTTEDPEELKRQLAAHLSENPALNKRVKISEAIIVWNTISLTEFNGATINELKSNTKLSLEDLNQLLLLFVQLSIAFPCGVDTKRYVAVEHSLPWLIKTDTHRFSARPWTLPNGSVNWGILRWMSESLLMSVYSKTGILFDEIVLLYSCVLSPVLVQELVDFLVALGCFKIETRELPDKKLSSPFASDKSPTKTTTFVQMNPEALNNFAVFFADTKLPDQLLNRK